MGLLSLLRLYKNSPGCFYRGNFSLLRQILPEKEGAYSWQRLFRTVILYLLLIAGLRITGKRQIGELEPIELVLTMLLSDLASVPMQDFGIPLVNGIVPIVTLLSLSMLLSYGSLRSVLLPHASVRGARP